MNYWAGIGTYQDEYDTLYHLLVPQQGMSGSTAGEILRAASNLYSMHYDDGGEEISEDYLAYARALVIEVCPRTQRYKMRRLFTPSGQDNDEGWDWMIDTVVLYVMETHKHLLKEKSPL